MTIFATPTVINGKESFYVVAKPSTVKNEQVNSSCRNDYKKSMTGGQHCQGVCIVINSTFTAGGLLSPIFLVIYGLSMDEMPSSEIITLPVPGLTVGSYQDIYSTSVGYITFVRGNEENNAERNANVDKNAEEINHDSTISDNCNSKESQIAELYRTKVYHPFLSHIRKTKYGWDGDEENILDYLQAVSWMDGANGQLKKITNIESLKYEEKMKVTCCKHSTTSCTGVKQAADCGLMFKVVKHLVREMDNPHSSFGSILHYLETKIEKLTSPSSPSSNQVLRLSSHKKKAILFTVPKLPIATGRAFTIDNVQKGFILNGQVDMEPKFVPCITNILHTYHGDIVRTCLEQKEKLFENFYYETFVTGMVKEDSYDNHHIPLDTNFKGLPVPREMDISLESRQHAKVLGSPVQVEARMLVVRNKRHNQFMKQMALYEKEKELYETNKLCEHKIYSLLIESHLQNTENKNNKHQHQHQHCQEDHLSFVDEQDKINHTFFCLDRE